MRDAEVAGLVDAITRVLWWAADLLNELAPVIALAGAIFLFFLQRRSDRNAQERRLKQEVYRQYLRWLADNVGYRGEPEKSRGTTFEIVRLRMEMMCLASDDVVRALEKVAIAVEAQNSSLVSRTSFLEAVGELVLSMRKDAFPDTKFVEADILKLLPLSDNESE